jgi:hypothetical protein
LTVRPDGRRGPILGHVSRRAPALRSR